MIFRRLLKLPYYIRNVSDYSRAFSKQEYTDMRAVRVDDEHYLDAARKLHANVYLHRGFVAEKDIENGVLAGHVDPYYPHSQYFVVEDKATGEIVATSRQIQAKRHAGHYSFAMFKHTPLYKKSRKLITSNQPFDCVEISGLAKRRGASKLAPLLLYRAMWHHSLRLNHELWLLAVDVNVYNSLKLLFGPALQKAGPITYYLGSDVVPAILRVKASVRALERSLDVKGLFQRRLRARVVRFVLKGIPQESLNRAEKAALGRIRAKYDKPVLKTSTLRQKLRLTAVVGLVAYTILRFLLVGGVFSTHGIDPWVFLFIDVVTVLPYVLGIEYLVVSLSRVIVDWGKVLFWGAVAALSFAAPYLYVVAYGGQLPAGLSIGLGVVVALLAVNAVASVIRRLRKNRQAI